MFVREQEIEINVVIDVFAESLGGRFTRWTYQFYLPDPGRLVEPVEAVGADPGQRGGACRPVGPQANHQPWSGLRDTDPLHHQGCRGKKTKIERTVMSSCDVWFVHTPRRS